MKQISILFIMIFLTFSAHAMEKVQFTIDPDAIEGNQIFSIESVTLYRRNLKTNQVEIELQIPLVNQSSDSVQMKLAHCNLVTDVEINAYHEQIFRFGGDLDCQRSTHRKFVLFARGRFGPHRNHFVNERDEVIAEIQEVVKEDSADEGEVSLIKRDYASAIFHSDQVE